MSFKKIYISIIGLLAILGIISLYFTAGGLLSQGNGFRVIKNVHANVTGSGNSRETLRQCVKNVNDVKIYAYMFHYIIPDKYVSKDNKIEYGNSIPPEKLENILRSLSVSRADGKIQIISLADLEDFRKTRCFPNKNLVLLTVDDGWDDGYNFLFPLAKKYNTKFNLGIIADKVSTVPAEINNFLNEREIQEMLSSGLITLASHSFSHIELFHETGTVLQKELLGSKQILEKWFHIRINTIVYPSGKYDDATLQEAKESGYGFGFTTKKGIITPEDLDKNPLILPRIRVNRDTDISKAFSFE